MFDPAVLEKYENKLQDLQAEIDATTYLGNELNDGRHNLAQQFFNEVQDVVFSDLEGINDLPTLREKYDAKIAELTEAAKNSKQLTVEINDLVNRVRDSFRDRLAKLLSESDSSSGVAGTQGPSAEPPA